MPDQVTPPTKTASPSQSSDASRGMTLFVMVVATLYFGKEVLVFVVLALLLAFILAPLVDLLRRIYLGRILSILLAVVLSLGIISAIGGVIGTQIGELSADMPKYVTTIDEKVATFKRYTIGELSKIAKSVGHHGDGSPALSLSLPALQAPSAQPQAPAAAQQSPATNPLDFAQRYLSAILTPLANFGIVFVVAVFALLQREDLRDRLIRLIGSEDLHRTTVAIDEAGRRLSRYFATQLSINTLFGVVIAIGLLVIGVPNPILWGILSALLRFVPYVGSFISAILPLALSAAVEPGWSMFIWTAALYAVVEALTGQVIEPLVYGHSTGLSPFSVVVAAIFWSWLWGPVGLILSTPLTLILVVMGRHVKRLEFLDVMLGDRSPLTPVESFYQRILAGDADEVQDHAEKLLKDRSLSTYYDEVAVKALRLAAHDAQREALGEPQLERVKATVRQLITGLDRYVDKQPIEVKADDGPVGNDSNNSLPRNPDPPTLAVPRDQLAPSWQSETAVLCIGGRGVFDEASVLMLSQLLGKHGLGTRVVTYGDVSRENIATIDFSGVAMVCIFYLDIVGAPAHLRYLTQRLRQKLGASVPLLVGVWTPGDRTLNDPSIKTTLGADYYPTSLEQAVAFCVNEAQKATV